MEADTIIHLVGGVPVALILLLMWREIRAVKEELLIMLKADGRRISRLEDKVFPTGPGLNEAA